MRIGWQIPRDCEESMASAVDCDKLMVSATGVCEEWMVGPIAS